MSHREHADGHGDDRQPLLPKQDDVRQRPRATGLPWGQVIVLAIWRSTHGLYFGFLLTWITRFLLSNQLATETSVGRVAGWIESAYSLGALMGLAPASYLSDSWGRKPTAICGILCASIGTIAFGFMRTIPTLVAIRCFVGFFIAFLPATILTSLIELSSPSTLPMVFSINSMSYRLGTLVAPLVGGFLAEPATHYPKIFGGTLWERYPYALSGVVAASIPLLATLVGFFIVQETLPIERRRSIMDFLRRREDEQSTSAPHAAQMKYPLKAMFTKSICFMLLLWGLYVFMQMTGVVTEVLFLSSSTSVGGLGLAPREMAMVYSTRAIMASASNILLYPPLARRYQPAAIFRWGITINNTTYYGLYFAFGMFAALYHPSHTLNLVLLFFLCIPLGINGSTATACMQALTSRVSSKAYLARISTAQEYVANFGSGIGSMVGSNAWALGVTYSVLHGQAVWLFLFIFAIGLAGLASLLTEQKNWQDDEADVTVTVDA